MGKQKISWDANTCNLLQKQRHLKTYDNDIKYHIKTKYLDITLFSLFRCYVGPGNNMTGCLKSD